jgi:hypothetical protein
MKAYRRRFLYLGVIMFIMAIKAIDYSLPLIGAKPAQFVCRNRTDVLLATVLDSAGVLLLVGPVFLLVWNTLIVRVFETEKIDLLKAWGICLLGLLFSVLINK